jgi:hypothetical protein
MQMPSHTSVATSHPEAATLLDVLVSLTLPIREFISIAQCLFNGNDPSASETDPRYVRRVYGRRMEGDGSGHAFSLSLRCPAFRLDVVERAQVDYAWSEVYARGYI